jgi:hypothetical protein
VALPECAGAGAGVGQQRIVLGNALEQRPGGREVTGPLIEVRQGVRPTEVVVAGTRWPAPTTSQQTDRFAKSVLICQRTSRHDPAFNHQCRIRRCITQFLPQGHHFAMTTQSPITIRQNGVLLHRTSQLAECLKFLDSRAPASLPVATEPEEFADFRHSRSLLGNPGDNAGGIINVFICIGGGRVGKSARQAGGTFGPHSLGEHLCQVTRGTISPPPPGS